MMQSNLVTSQADDLLYYYDELVDYINAKLNNRRVAIDVVHETYLRVLQKPEQFVHLASPISFLRTVSLNIALDYARKDSTYQKYFEELEPESFSVPVGLDGYTEQEFSVLKQQYGQLIYDRIEMLPPACRDVYLLVQFHGLSQVDVAEQLEISRTMVATHLTRALHSLLPLFTDPNSE